MMRAAIIVRVEEPKWRNCGVESGRIRAAACLALMRGHGRNGGDKRSLTILLASDERLREGPVIQLRNDSIVC